MIFGNMKFVGSLQTSLLCIVGEFAVVVRQSYSGASPNETAGVGNWYPNHQQIVSFSELNFWKLYFCGKSLRDVCKKIFTSHNFF